MAGIKKPETRTSELIQPSRGSSRWQQITAVFRQPKKFSLSYLALSILVAILFISNVLLWQQINKMEPAPEPGRLMAIRLTSTSVIPDADGYITISGDGLSGAIVLDRLPQLQQDQQYQLWLVKDEQRTSAALLSVDELGYGARRVRAPESLFNYAWAEVTIEAAGGNAQPTTAVILNAPLFP
jgi:anti-sigma-K factor RskA